MQVLDGVSVYEARLNMGHKLASKVLRVYPELHIDVVMPIPDTSRVAALQCAVTLGVSYREGFVKNRYIARTFIMPVSDRCAWGNGCMTLVVTGSGNTQEDCAFEA